ncbi:FAD-dependent monooxygenase [Rhodopseudomonas sp. B29]|uniref:FAD-dependent monooxygenase n=1 Tax=Rhodopseudomonas sp. B29 TaxID=95607 RepID=UPI000346F53C|nr:FAD-dependent monooxygenase [Rhodopseudomonas sp. B29]
MPPIAAPIEKPANNFDFEGFLHGAIGAAFDVEFDHIGFWDLRFAVADSYRAGRVFIAGDAAHSHPPYGGYGINSGLEDAVNLSWKLAAKLQGWGSEALLDSYDLERRPVFASTARFFIEKSILDDRDFLRAHDPARDKADFEAAWKLRQTGATAEVNAFEPNYEGSPIVIGAHAGTPSAIGSHAYQARAGHHLAPHPLSGGANVFDRLGDGFTLIDLGSDAARTKPFVDAAKSLGVPLTVITDTADDGREKYQAELILVRPDQFVAYAGDDCDADALLRQAAGVV